MVNEGVLEKALEALRSRIPQFANPGEQPARFVRDLHKHWKDVGGKLAGKPRHSDRYLEDQLNTKGSRIKSLTPKLVGKTNISPADGSVLVHFILSNWPEPGAEDGEVEYKPVLSVTEIDAIAGHVEDQLKQPSTASAAQSPASSDDGAKDEIPGEPQAQLIARLFQDCDAIITVAPEQVFVAARPKTELVGFRDLMDLLRKIEATDRKPRLLVWVLDLGGPSLEDLSTRRKYLNVQELIVRFKALMHYKDVYSEERLEWLKARSAIVILDTYGDWRGRVNVLKLPHFSTHHASLTTTATEWLGSTNFRALYGPDLKEDRMRQRVFQVFFDASGEWHSDPNVEGDLRYVGFAPFTKSNGDVVGTGLELPPLPERYAEAFRTVCVAAASFLRMKIATPKSFQHTGDEALKQLQYLGYRILNIDDFLEQY